MKYLLILLVFASCSKEYDREPKPSDKRVQEKVKQLQGWPADRKEESSQK